MPEYLTLIPADRFSPEDSSYSWSGDVYYSMGPDGGDDKVAIAYEPTNGTVSGGDVILRTPALN